MSLPLFVASIPSPGSGALHIGPLQLRAYGLMIALGVLAGASLAGRRYERMGGDRQQLSTILMWAVPAGVVGARIYHVMTDWRGFRGRWIETLYIWKGGLGIWGGVALGAGVAFWQARKMALNFKILLDAVAPALALAQAIGRWGNWWNQELFGRPTTMPWGLKIDAFHTPLGYKPGTLFHPTFLYESLWNFALCGVLLVISRRGKQRQGQLFCIYVMGYTFARFFIERVRIDKASIVFGLRINEWVSIVVFAGAMFVYARLNDAPEDLAFEADHHDGDGSADLGPEVDRFDGDADDKVDNSWVATEPADE